MADGPRMLWTAGMVNMASDLFIENARALGLIDLWVMSQFYQSWKDWIDKCIRFQVNLDTGECLEAEDIERLRELRYKIAQRILAVEAIYNELSDLIAQGQMI